MRRELYEQMIGRNAAFAHALLTEQYGADFDFDGAAQLHLEHIDAHFEKHGVPIKAGLPFLLDELERLGIRKCVATSTGRERATHKLTLAGLAHRFEAIVGGDEVVHSKPDPEIFLKAAARCGIPPEESLVIEDSAAGTQGAHRAGMPVIIVPDIAPLSPEIRALAYAVCADLTEVARHIAG
jgi:HAD superfamily hydrolase (TIGR01509 family)